ncbi:hypothetical protein PSP6_80085 [Paraburkholderia tropica]|nr:hypothetical protein PSP6_80085 [Paraburkholderia tropica]
MLVISANQELGVHSHAVASIQPTKSAPVKSNLHFVSGVTHGVPNTQSAR